MKPFFLRAVALVLVLAAVLAGCGGGEAPATMNLKAAAVPGDETPKAAAPFTGHGVWWNPAEPGSGFFFEAQGVIGVVTFYMYETNGRPAWYTGAGSFKAVGDKYQFDGTLQRFSGGQPGRSQVFRPATAAPAGTVTLTFDGLKAQGVVAGRAISAEKYFKSGTPASIYQPETGIYWNPAENGRGYTIEVNGNVALVTAFHYADDGQPIWHLSAVPFASPATGSGTGDFVAYAGGQALSGAYKAPASSAVEGTLTIKFNGACSGELAYPEGFLIPIKRFAFGAAGAECRAAAGGQGKLLVDQFAGTWVGCYVNGDFTSRREAYRLQKASDVLLAYTFSTTQHANRDCSGAGTAPTEQAGTLDFRPNVSTIMEGVVTHRAQGVEDSSFKRIFGLQNDGMLRVGLQDLYVPEDGWANKLSPVLYMPQ